MESFYTFEELDSLWATYLQSPYHKKLEKLIVSKESFEEVLKNNYYGMRDYLHLRSIINIPITHEIGYKSLPGDRKAQGFWQWPRQGLSSYIELHEQGRGRPALATVLLAHEYGHYLSLNHLSDRDSKAISVLQDTYAALEDQKAQRMSEANKKLALSSEIIAWNRGRQVLVGIGYKKWDFFKRYCKWALSTYEYALGISIQDANLSVMANFALK